MAYPIISKINPAKSTRRSSTQAILHVEMYNTSTNIK